MYSLKQTLSLTFAALFVFTATSIMAKSPAELAKESTAYCKETAKDASKLTPKLIMEKVNKAAALIEKEGPAAFAKLQGNGSEFLFCGTYIWVHDLNGIMKCHPIKFKLNGKKILSLKDRNGKMLFVEMNKVAKEKGSGWVDYVWPKPGDKKPSPKISYVKKASHGGTDYVVGCGVYDMTMDDVNKALGK